MNPQTYAQMLELQQQKGAPLTSQGQAPMQQQAPAGAQRYDSSNPLSEGSMAAVNAARQSMSGAAPKKKGFIDSMLRMVEMGAIAKLRGSRELAAQNLGNMIKTPDEADEAMRAQEAARAAENFKMMQFLQSNEHMRQQHSHKQSMLNEQRRHHDMQSRHQGAHSDYYRAMSEKARREGMADFGSKDLPPGAIPYAGRTSADKSGFTKEMRERANKPNRDIKVLRTLDKMSDIVDKYPDLSTSVSAAMFPGKYEGGVLNTAALSSMPHEKRVALEKLNKLSNDLVLKQVHGLGGQRASIFLEKIMQASNPHSGLTPEAIRAIRDNFKEDYDESLTDSKVVRKALQGNYYVPMMEPDYSENKENDLSNLSDEELMRLAE